MAKGGGPPIIRSLRSADGGMPEGRYTIQSILEESVCDGTETNLPLPSWLEGCRVCAKTFRVQGYDTVHINLPMNRSASRRP